MVHHLDRFSNAQQKELILCFCVISRETNKLHIMYTLSAIAWSNFCIAAALASIGLASLYGLFRTREDHSVKTMLGVYALFYFVLASNRLLQFLHPHLLGSWETITGYGSAVLGILAAGIVWPVMYRSLTRSARRELEESNRRLTETTFALEHQRDLFGLYSKPGRK